MGTNITNLGKTLRNAVDNRINEEARAKYGKIEKNMFRHGGRCYPYKQAVDCNVSNGQKVWAQLSAQGNAIIIGA